MLIHGLFDDPFYGYGAYLLPLLFVPLGLDDDEQTEDDRRNC